MTAWTLDKQRGDVWKKERRERNEKWNEMKMFSKKKKEEIWFKFFFKLSANIFRSLYYSKFLLLQLSISICNDSMKWINKLFFKLMKKKNVFWKNK
jgi:hypothetical protein